MQKSISFVPYRRKREGRTNYRKRLKSLVSGMNRLIVRKTNKNMIVQLAAYSDRGDKILVGANSSELKEYGWNISTSNIPASYLTGLLLAKKAIAAGHTGAIVDLGLQTPAKKSRLYAAVKGAIDAGMSIPSSDEIFPPDERLKGKHVADFRKNDADKTFDAVKSKILS